MILSNESRFLDTLELPIAASTSHIYEGTPLQIVYESGVAKVKPTAGGSSEVFGGIALNAYAPQTTRVMVETGIAVAAGSAQLSRAVSGNATTIYAVASTTGALTGVTGSPSSGEVKVNASDASKLDLNTAQNGETLTVTYRTDLTVAESVALYGDSRQPSTVQATDALTSTGVVIRGQIATTEFDAASNWAAGGAVRLGASGRFSLGGSGTSLSANVFILRAPSVDNPSLLVLVK